MYTVIIQNKQTLDSFGKYYPLFLEAVNLGKVGVCRWIESGVSVDTALPELASLTDDKPEWRAVIVRLFDETAMSGFPSKPDNPFDFDASCNGLSADWCNLPPLVRLTQILGGTPTAALSFEATIEDGEEYMSSRMVFTPVEDSEESKSRKRLADQYYYNGKHPSEIILISVRKKAVGPAVSVDDVWENHSETENSEFWRRNLYPTYCRFMVYEMERQGPIVEAADMFSFWASVMLMAANRVDPNALQAYRLYRFSVEYNAANMKLCFQQTFNRLLSARVYVSESVTQEEYLSESLDDILPDYEMEVPVVVKSPKGGSKIKITPSSFGFFAGDTSVELSKWNNMRETASAKIRLTLKNAEQSLDMTADKVRDRLGFEDCASYPVDKYQISDIGTDLDTVYHDILRLQSELPREDSAFGGKFEEADKLIKDNIALRMTSKKALYGYALVAALALFAVIPEMYLHSQRENGTVKGIVALAAVCVILPCLIELAVLFAQRHKLRKSVQNYKHTVNAFLTRLHVSISSYSRYMSEIASHARGHAFLRTVKRQKLYKENTYTAKQRHIRDINLFIASLNEWGRAFYAPVKHDEAETYQYVDIDTTVPSNKNDFYTLERNENHQVQLNHSGDLLETPVDFIDRLVIEREELYDND